MPVSKPLNPRGWPINIGGGLVASEIAQSCPTLCDPMDCSLPVSSVYGICQKKIFEVWLILFSPKHLKVPVPPRSDLPYSPGKADGNSVSKVPGCFSKSFLSLYGKGKRVPEKHLFLLY